jgi:hypothetical protein
MGKALLRPKQLGQIMRNCEQMQFHGKAREAPQSQAPNTPVVLPAPEDRFNNGLPLPVNCFPVFRPDFFSNLAYLHVIYAQFYAAKSTLMICTLRTERTIPTIRTTIDLRGLPASVVVPIKWQSLPLRAGELVHCFVIYKPADVIRCLVAFTALRIVHLGRGL